MTKLLYNIRWCVDWFLYRISNHKDIYNRLSWVGNNTSEKECVKMYMKGSLKNIKNTFTIAFDREGYSTIFLDGNEKEDYIELTISCYDEYVKVEKLLFISGLEYDSDISGDMFGASYNYRVKVKNYVNLEKVIRTVNYFNNEGIYWDRIKWENFFVQH